MYEMLIFIIININHKSMFYRETVFLQLSSNFMFFLLSAHDSQMLSRGLHFRSYHKAGAWTDWQDFSGHFQPAIISTRMKVSSKQRQSWLFTGEISRWVEIRYGINIVTARQPNLQAPCKCQSLLCPLEMFLRLRDLISNLQNQFHTEPPFSCGIFCKLFGTATV